MVATYQDDHVTDALDLLPGQFQDSTALRAFVSALIGPSDPTTWGVQELEDVAWDLYTLRWLSSATGQQLDDLGTILDEPRPDSDDEVYRDRLYLKVLVNTSQGNPERMITVALRASGGSLVHLLEKRSATHVLYCHEIDKFDWLDHVPAAALGGVRTVLTGCSSDEPFVFGLDRDAAGTGYGTELAYGEGWGECGAGNEAMGGDFTELYVQA